MREIKFRAWEIEDKCYYHDAQKAYDWHEEHEEEGCIPVESFDELLGSDFFIIEQYTGIKDKNGVEIYEGDILRDNEWDDIFEATPAEWFECDAFNVYGYPWTVRFIDNYDDPKDNMLIKHCEVIGNIHENPEIL